MAEPELSVQNPASIAPPRLVEAREPVPAAGLSTKIHLALRGLDALSVSSSPRARKATPRKPALFSKEPRPNLSSPMRRTMPITSEKLQPRKAPKP